MESEPELIFYRNWSESVRRSTWRELKAVCLALLAFASPSSNSKVFWYSDNQNVESILRDGSRKCDLKDLALFVFQICAHHCISLEVKWIPRDLNASAGCICKLVDFSGYGLNDFVLLGLNHLLGPYIIDRFACSYNGELPWLTLYFFSQAVRLFMPSLKIGDRTTTGLAHLFASLSESCISDTLCSARSRSPYSSLMEVSYFLRCFY